MPLCTVKFGNSSKGIYYSGQTLCGTVTFDNEKSRKFYSLTLNFEGFAKCKWSVKKSQHHTVTYKGRENYINRTVQLIKNDDKTKPFELVQGVHHYPFTIDIPTNFPTSIESPSTSISSSLRGCVRYMLTVRAERSWKSDLKFEFPVSIIKNFDLNFGDLRFRNPMKVEETKIFSLSSKKIYMSVETSKTGYVAGEAANLLFFVNNESSANVEAIQVELVRHINFNCDEPKRKTNRKKEVLKTLRFQGVVAKTTKQIEGSILIPSIAPTSDGSCRILEVFYEIKVTALLSGLHSNFSMKFPIIIGTVPYGKTSIRPITTTLNTIPPLVMPSTSNQHNIRSIYTRDSVGWNLGPSTSSAPMPRPFAPIPTSPEDYDMPPPTYMEAVSAKSIEKETTSDNESIGSEGSFTAFDFNPSYPVYSFDNNNEDSDNEEQPPKYEKL